MVLELHRHQVCEVVMYPFSILTRIDGFGTRRRVPQPGSPWVFQHPNSDRWFWNDRYRSLGIAALLPFTILIRYDGFGTLTSASIAGIQDLFQHPNSDRWFWNVDRPVDLGDRVPLSAS